MLKITDELSHPLVGDNSWEMMDQQGDAGGLPIDPWANNLTS